MKTYKITSGTFKTADGTVLETGAPIQLEDDVAALHATRLQLVDAADAPSPTRFDGDTGTDH